MITIEFDPEARKFVKGLKGAERRMQFGTARLLAFVAQQVAADVAKRADGKVLDYSKLIVARIGRPADMQVALLLPAGPVTLTAATMESTVVYPQSSASDPKIEVLLSHGPWPANMVPLGIPDDAPVTFVGRRVDPAQAKERGDEMMTPGLEALIKSRGMTPTRTRDVFPWPVEEDAIWIAVRSEYGIDTESVPHWRPAIKGAQGHVTSRLLDALATYILTGDQSVLRRTYKRALKRTDADEAVMVEFQKRLGLL